MRSCATPFKLNNDYRYTIIISQTLNIVSAIWVEKIFHSLLILIMKNFGARYALLGDVFLKIFAFSLMTLKIKSIQ